MKKPSRRHDSLLSLHQRQCDHVIIITVEMIEVILILIALMIIMTFMANIS